MAIILLTNVFGTAIFTTLLSFYYGNWKKQHIITTIIVAISWWLPALILTTLPVDIASTYYMNCTLGHQVSEESSPCRPPPFHAEPGVFLVLWHSAYWSSQVLTWIIIPLMRSYTTAGDFTALAKFRSAILDNVLYYTSYLGLFIAVLIYLLATRTIFFDLQYLKILLITTSNTWGLVLVVIFLGYGLVEVPRSLWLAGNPVSSLQEAYLSLSTRNAELIDEEEKLSQLVSEVDYMKARLPLAHPLQPYLLTVYNQAHSSNLPSGATQQPSRAVDRPDLESDNLANRMSINLRQLAQLHRKLKSTQHRRDRAQALYEEAARQALWKEDVHAYRSQRRGPLFRDLADATGRRLKGSSGLSRFLPVWFWHVYLQSISLRVIAVILACLSLVVVWSECTFFVRTPTLSVIALLLKIQAYVRDYFLLEISSFLALFYLSFAVFYTVFRLRIFNYYRLVGSHHTDENSLLFCGALLCRLTPSLCLNFLGLVHLDSHLSQTTLFVPQTAALGTSKVGEVFTSVHNLTVETAYTQFMGHLDMIPFIANGFNVYFPILVLLLCLMTYFRLGSRILHQLGVPQLVDTSATYDPGRQSMDSLTDEAIQDGRLLARRERLALSRTQATRSNDNDLSIGQGTNATRLPSDRIKLLRDSNDEIDESNGGRGLDNSPNTDSFGIPVEYSEDQINKQFAFRHYQQAPKTSRW